MNIKKFLTDHKVYWTDEGHNVKRGNINVQCPFCGEADRSEHMGISLQKPHIYGCWRNKKHRGTNIVDLIVALTNYSWAEAKAFVNADKPLLEGESASELVSKIFNKADEEPITGVEELQMPEEFKTVVHVSVYRKFHSYLHSRGYEFYEIKNLIEHYDLRGCLRGDYAYRLIIPVYFENALSAWTGRVIGGKETLRYMDLSPDKSVIPLKESLLDYDFLLNQGGRRLYIVEGAFDSFPIYLWGGSDVEATCSFTVNISMRQQTMISRLSKVFDEVVILPDSEFEVNAYEAKAEMSHIKNLHVQLLPKGVSDPGSLTKEQVVELVNAEIK